jgi:hypothetical protein
MKAVIDLDFSENLPYSALILLKEGTDVFWKTRFRSGDGPSSHALSRFLIIRCVYGFEGENSFYQIEHEKRF